MQTYITQRLVSYLSDELNTTVSIRGVNIELFKTIVLEDVYIEDLHADTLLYASLLKVNIDDFNLKKHLLYINQIELEETTFNLRKYRGEEDNNLKFITDLFSREGESNVKWDIKLASVSIVKSKFSYANENKEWNGGAINFQDLRLTQINAEISNFKLEGDTIYGMVEELSCLEKSGFHLQNFQGEVKTSPTGMDVDSLIINTRASTIVASISFRYNKYRDFLSFVDSVQISSEFRESKVNMSDIAYFAPGLDGISYQYKLTGKVRGLISRLKGKNVELQFGNYSRLTGDFSLNGLPDVRETFIFFRVKDLRTQKSDIEKIPIPPFKERITLKVPPLVGNLGHIRFHGELTGFYNDFVAYGDFHTSIGTLVSDLSLKEDTVANLIRYAGSLSSPGFNVGDFLSIEEGVGNAVFDVNIRGSGLKKTTAKANLKGVISSIFLNKYNYQNINLEGELQNRHYEGRFVVNDQNVNLLFNGEIDFLQSPPSFDFQASIAEANLAKLNLANEDSIAILSANLMSNFSGNDIDNMMGALKISEIIFQHRSSGDSIVQENLGDLNLTVKDEGGDRSLNLVSEFMNVEIKGNYSFGELIPSFAEILKDVIPSSTFVEQHSHKDHDNQEFSYEIEIKDASKISEILLPGIFIANGTNIKGEYSHDKKKFSLLANSPQVKLYGKTLSDWSINAQLKHSNDTSSGSTGNQLVINSSCEKLAFSDSAWLSNFNVKTITQNDSLYFNAQWNNESSPQYSGNINGYTLFKLLADSLDDDGDDLGKRVVQLSFLPSEFTITDSIWNIDKGNAITYDSTSIRFENLVVQSGNRKITVLGSSSVKDAGGIMLTIEDVELSLLNPLTKRNRLKWNGISNGSITVSNLFSDPYLTGTMNVSDLELNGKKVGNAALSGNWNSNAERVQILMNVTRGSLNTLAANGFYYLDSLHTAKGELIDIDVALVKMKIDILEPYLKTVFPDISDRSTASGKLVLSGSLKQPLLTGKLNIQRGGFTVGYINTKYNFADEIILDEKWIGFDNVVLNDLKGNRAVASGKIYHNHFRNFSYDISVEPVNLHTLNTTVAQNDVFYGQAFTTGKMKIEGDARGILLAPSLKTEKGTQVFIPLTGAEEVSGGGFVIFINPKDTLNGLSSKQNGNLQKKAGLLQVKFDLEITPEAEVQLILTFSRQMGRETYDSILTKPETLRSTVTMLLNKGIIFLRCKM